MTYKKTVTLDDLKAVEARLCQHPKVTEVSVLPVLQVTVKVADDEARLSVYEAEGKLIDEFPELCFDFHTETS